MLEGKRNRRSGKLRDPKSSPVMMKKNSHPSLSKIGNRRSFKASPPTKPRRRPAERKPIWTHSKRSKAEGLEQQKRTGEERKRRLTRTTYPAARGVSREQATTFW